MTCRRSLSRSARLRIFEAAGGLCHICGLKIHVATKWDVEHRIPLALGGKDDASNMSPAHKSCHAPKTVEDAGRIAKAKRQASKHWDRQPSRNPVPGSRRTKWRKRMNGRAELR